MNRVLIAVIFLAMLGYACSLPDNPECIPNNNPFHDFPPPFGKEYNSVRKQIGLPIIPDDWEAEYYTGEADITWYNPNASQYRVASVPYHGSKTIKCINGVLISESDYYYGNEYFWMDAESLVEEHITITYYYPTADSEAHWEVSALLKERTHDLDKEDAIKILAKWGIAYP